MSSHPFCLSMSCLQDRDASLVPLRCAPRRTAFLPCVVAVQPSDLQSCNPKQILECLPCSLSRSKALPHCPPPQHPPPPQPEPRPPQSLQQIRSLPPPSLSLESPRKDLEAAPPQHRKQPPSRPPSCFAVGGALDDSAELGRTSRPKEGGPASRSQSSASRAEQVRRARCSYVRRTKPAKRAHAGHDRQLPCHALGRYPAG
mmetsp:Transcript_94064/g.205990  ORF Transcript_94064/g.205990 Transcript_94064/m.205990 type:complete len:201 (-) Transcript_94064:1714-2316(-)